MKKRVLVFVLSICMVLGNLSVVSAEEIAGEVNLQETVIQNENSGLPDGLQEEVNGQESTEAEITGDSEAAETAEAS